MTKSENAREIDNVSKGNSEDSLLVIYIFHILKKYSSPDKPLSTQDVMDYLEKDYSIGNAEKSDAQKKKIRRHLDTLHECYGNGCIEKIEGKTRKGHDWYYVVSRDKFADEEVKVKETLSEVELEFIIDLISATKVLNAESTLGMVDKLLKKTSLSEEERERRIKAIKREAWTKNQNDDLVAKKEIVDACIDVCRIRFDYEGKRAILAVPCGWLYVDGICFLKAKVGGQYQQFALSKMHDIEEVDDYDDPDEYGYYDEDDTSNYAALDSLFGNIPFLKTAIKEKRGITFKYLTYVVQNNRVVFEENTKNVLPHSLVFNDGKYYLIGIDEDANETSKVGYFRVDLIVDFDYSETKIKLSDWNKQVYDTIQRAREIEKHPLMVAGEDIRVEFSVLESALDRVRDAFGSSPIFQVTKETRSVLKEEKFGEESAQEKVVKVFVRTTRDEAFRWALANADAVELIYPQDIRDSLRRIGNPIHYAYTKTLTDIAREKASEIEESWIFETAYIGEEKTTKAVCEELKRRNKTDVVVRITIHEAMEEPGEYYGEFINTEVLEITDSFGCKNPTWASKLTNINKVEISHTYMENVSWLKDLKNLRWLELHLSPIKDLSVLSDHKRIHILSLCDLEITDISFIEQYQRLKFLDVVGCPIKDYTPILRIPPLEQLMIDEDVVESLGMDAIVQHHPNASIDVRRKKNNNDLW